MTDLLKYLSTEWATISKAPFTFFIAVATIAVLAWAWGRFQAKDKIDSLDARLKLRDDEIADYRRKLDGQSPDEAHAQIEELRAKIEEFAAYGLSKDAQQRFKDALAGVSGPVNVYRDTDASDADRLYRQVVSIFRGAGWTVDSHTIWGMKNAPDCGVSLVSWDKTDAGLTDRVRAALDVAGLDVQEVNNPERWGDKSDVTVVFSSRDPDWTPKPRWG